MEADAPRSSFCEKHNIGLNQAADDNRRLRALRRGGWREGLTSEWVVVVTCGELILFPWTSVQGTIHTRTLKNKLPFPVHVAGVLDQNRPGRAFLRPTLSGDVPSLSLDYGKKRIGPPDHRTSLLEVATSSSSVRSAGADRG